MRVGDVAIREDDLRDGALPDERLQVRLRDDRNALRIEAAAQPGGVAAARDAGNLGGRERDDLRRRVVAVDRVEIVKIASRGAQDDDAGAMSGIEHESPLEGLSI